MKGILTDSEISEATIAAMAPHRCVPEFDDYGNQFGFAVYVEGRDRVVIDGFITRDIRKPARLQAVLLQARGDLERSGIQFDPWQGTTGTTEGSVDP